MKKKFLFIGFVLVAAVASFQLNSKSKNLERLMLENIEALAYGETGNVYICAGVGSVDCPISSSKVKYVAKDYSLEELY
ncbi:NVEALA domain-containing protein [Bacteroides rodentium]